MRILYIVNLSYIFRDMQILSDSLNFLVKIQNRQTGDLLTGRCEMETSLPSNNIASPRQFWVYKFSIISYLFSNCRIGVNILQGYTLSVCSNGKTCLMNEAVRCHSSAGESFQELLDLSCGASFMLTLSLLQCSVIWSSFRIFVSDFFI